MFSISISCCNRLLPQYCCICHQHRKAAIVCNKCNEGVVCVGCIGALCESAYADRCPICRNTQWRQNQINKTTIVPIAGPRPIIEAEETRRESLSCHQIYHIVTFCASYFFLSFVLGYIAVSIFDPHGTVRSNPYLFWIQVPIGLILMTLICYGCKSFILSIDR